MLQKKLLDDDTFLSVVLKEVKDKVVERRRITLAPVKVIITGKSINHARKIHKVGGSLFRHLNRPSEALCSLFHFRYVRVLA